MRKCKKYIAAAMAALMLTGAYGPAFAEGNDVEPEDPASVKELKEQFFAWQEGIGTIITLLGSGEIEQNAQITKWACYDFDAYSKAEVIPGMWKTLVISGEAMLGPFYAEGLLPDSPTEDEGKSSLADPLTPWGACNADIKYIYVEEGVTGIGRYAFIKSAAGCTIYIPASVTTIQEDAIAEQVVISGWPGSEAELYASKNGNEFKPIPVSGNTAIAGDVNGNGKLDASDALGVLKMIVDLEPLYKWTGDANKDGNVTTSDALYILKDMVGLN